MHTPTVGNTFQGGLQEGVHTVWLLHPLQDVRAPSVFWRHWWHVEPFSLSYTRELPKTPPLPPSRTSTLKSIKHFKNQNKQCRRHASEPSHASH